MLWYKAWLESRWRFAASLSLLVVVAAGTVTGYPAAREMAPLAQHLQGMTGPAADEVRESLALASSYRGYVWLRWHSDNLALLGTLFAIVLGSGNVVSRRMGRANLFTLSLPVSRHRLLGVSAGLGLMQWLAVVLASSLVIPILSPAVGESYNLTDTLVHVVSAFVGGSVFLSLAVLLSIFLDDIWRPMLIALAVAVVCATCEFVLGDVWPAPLLGVMAARTYFESGQVSWLGLLASGAASGVLLFLAAQILARRDF